MASSSRIRRLVNSQHLKSFNSFSPPRLIHRCPIRGPIRSPILHLQGSTAFSKICQLRNFSYGTVNLVISEGKPKFETQEFDPPKKEKWTTKKRLKLRRMREKKIRRAANKKDPRRLTVKGKKRKQMFASAEERITYKLEKARIKEALLIERLKRYEVPKLQGPVVQPHELTGEQRFYLKKMGQKASNYVPIGRRGIFGGVILNMHMHWKKHETVKVFCKPCKPGQIQEYAEEIARLSGGVPIQIIGDDTMIFYRGKNYVRPEIMSPIDTLSKKRALEKSKYEQSLESVRHYIAVAEKELELYYRHIALYGNSPYLPGGDLGKKTEDSGQVLTTVSDTHDSFTCSSGTATSSTDQELSDAENKLEDDLSSNDSDSDDTYLSGEYNTGDTESESTDQELSEREKELREDHYLSEADLEDAHLSREVNAYRLGPKQGNYSSCKTAHIPSPTESYAEQ